MKPMTKILNEENNTKAQIGGYYASCDDMKQTLRNHILLIPFKEEFKNGFNKAIIDYSSNLEPIIDVLDERMINRDRNMDNFYFNAKDAYDCGYYEATILIKYIPYKEDYKRGYNNALKYNAEQYKGRNDNPWKYKQPIDELHEERMIINERITKICQTTELNSDIAYNMGYKAFIIENKRQLGEDEYIYPDDKNLNSDDENEGHKQVEVQHLQI